MSFSSFPNFRAVTASPNPGRGFIMKIYSKLVNLEINRGVTQGNLLNYGTAATIEGGDSAVLRVCESL